MSSNNFITGINLVPATGEFAYDTVPYRQNQNVLNCYADGSLQSTDIIVSIEKLLTNYPSCKTINIVVAWFCDSLDASQAHVFPSTVLQNTTIESFNGKTWIDDNWACSGLTQDSVLITIPPGMFNGTPSDQSVVRLIKYLKAKNLNVVFYPMIEMITSASDTRAAITLENDLSDIAKQSIQSFVGNATPTMFTQNMLTVSYSGPADDWTYRRMILHYANLCIVAGGVDLFLIGSGLTGLECLRGPAWTVQGVIGTNHTTTWDYPFVDALNQLADDVQSIFVVAKTTTQNLITYSADWSVWMGCLHGTTKIPNLDQLYSNKNIDFVSINNYFPLSDWTTSGGLDEINWSASPSVSSVSYPPSPTRMNNLGLSGTPSLSDPNYISANIEGGEQFYWFYADDGSSPQNNISVPFGSRATQTRSNYSVGQNLLAAKQIRWWWNNTHQAVFNAKDGMGIVAHGPKSCWQPQSKPIIFAEYGFPSVDRSTNQPDSILPYWASLTQDRSGNNFAIKNEELFEIALQAIFDYWQTNNQIVSNVTMIDQTFCSVWNWDGRAYPIFPLNPSWNVAVRGFFDWLNRSLK